MKVLMKKFLFLILLYGFFNSSFPLFGKNVVPAEVIGNPGPNTSLKNGDFNIWNYESVKAFINPNFWVYMETNFRYDDNGSHFYYFHEHLQLTWKPFSFLTIAPSYRQIFAIPGEGALLADIFPQINYFIPVYYPNVNIAFLWDTTYLHFRDRSRIAYELLPSQLSAFNAWIYRNKFVIRTRQYYSPLKLRFFLDGEIFIRQRRGVDEYRTSASASMKFIKKVRLQVGYRFVYFRLIDDWISKNVLFIRLDGSF